jgi:RES domain-containing protein
MTSVDLRAEADRRSAGVAAEDMACAWFAEIAEGREPPSWRLAERLIAGGAAGLITPSYAAPAGPADANFVLWRWSARLPHKVTVFDPSGRLPKNQLSWE